MPVTRPLFTDHLSCVCQQREWFWSCKTFCSQRQNPVTYREAKILFHSWFNGDRKNKNRGYQAHLDPIWRLEQAQQTTIFRLHTGHCGLRAHLKRTGISDTSPFECVQADQTLDRVLQSCPIYTERRQLTCPQGADLVTKLWGSAEDLYQTAGLWHQQDWRSDLHSCRSLKKNKKKFPNIRLLDLLLADCCKCLRSLGHLHLKTLQRSSCQILLSTHFHKKATHSDFTVCLFSLQVNFRDCSC